MGVVFLSYRRIDVGLPLAGRVFDVLAKTLGPESVFLDSALRIGADWPAEIDFAIHQCQALVPLIGLNWMAPGLFQSGNWTRREIAVALKRRIPIFPLFIDGGTPPSSEALPPDIAPLSDKQGFYIDSRSDAVFRASLETVAHAISSTLGLTPATSPDVSCEIIILREPPKSNWLEYEWRLFVDGQPVATLAHHDVFKSIRVTPGVHTLAISWKWEASYVRSPQGGTAPTYSQGTSLPLTTEFVSGRYHFTLRALDRGFWKALGGAEPECVIVNASPRM